MKNKSSKSSKIFRNCHGKKLSTWIKKEIENTDIIDDFREQLNVKQRELPEFLNELEEIKKSYSKIIDVLERYKNNKDGDQFKTDADIILYGEDRVATFDMWKNHVSKRILPFLQRQYPELDCAVIIDFGCKIYHKDYINGGPSTQKRFYFQYDDVKKNIIQSCNTVKNRGASKHTLTCTWAALCRALVWEAKHNRQYFPGDCTERSLAFIEYCEHYEQIARDIMPGIKQFKKIMARDRHRHEATGEGKKYKCSQDM